jgi:uncharacterized protein (DUF362 family)
MKRRDFLKTLSAASLAGLSAPRLWSSTGSAAAYFGVHPFINNTPDAVFILRTSIADKHDSASKKTAGSAFAKSVFVPRDSNDQAFPLSHKVVIKPNLTSRGKGWQSGYTIERSMGVITDADFVEGVIEGIKPLGVDGGQFYIREVNGVENMTEGGYEELGRQTGADVNIIPDQVNNLKPEQVVWKETTNGVWFNTIPYLWPVNAPDSVLLNISKLKSHGMGMTLCAKNLQGTIAASYQQHCTTLQSEMSISPTHIQPNAKNVIQANYQRHLAAGIPRWDRPGTNGGLWQETWASRCLDNNSTLHPELHVIEGLYGHDGNFIEGPHDGYAADFLTNVIIFGKNPFHVDIIGAWLAGHEPGNFGLFHLAIERGLSRLLDPFSIPVYEWHDDATAVLTPLDHFERTPLVTYYLQRDYNGQTEPYWHLVDEPFDYGAAAVSSQHDTTPQAFEVEANYPNPFNSSTAIPISLPSSGRLRVDIYNSLGECVARPSDDYLAAGKHLIQWQAIKQPSGVYFYRCFFNGQVKSGRMLLVR